MSRNLSASAIATRVSYSPTLMARRCTPKVSPAPSRNKPLLTDYHHPVAIDARHTWATLALRNPACTRRWCRSGWATHPSQSPCRRTQHAIPSMHEDAAETVASMIRAAKDPKVVLCATPVRRTLDEREDHFTKIPDQRQCLVVRGGFEPPRRYGH